MYTGIQSTPTHVATKNRRFLEKSEEMKNARSGKNVQNVVHAPYNGIGHRPVLGQSFGICELLRRKLGQENGKR